MDINSQLSCSIEGCLVFPFIKSTRKIDFEIVNFQYLHKWGLSTPTLNEIRQMIAESL